MQNAPERMNDSGTRTPTRAESVQAGSLPVLISALARARRGHPKRDLIVILIKLQSRTGLETENALQN